MLRGRAKDQTFHFSAKCSSDIQCKIKFARRAKPSLPSHAADRVIKEDTFKTIVSAATRGQILLFNWFNLI